MIYLLISECALNYIMHKRSNNLVPLLGEPVFYCNIQPQHLLAVRGRNGILSKNALQVENWDVSDVVDWLGGIVDYNANCLRHFRKAEIDGKRLLNVDHDSLYNLGINKEWTRTKIMHGIELLTYYNFELRFTNLQKLAMDASLSASNLLQAVTNATPVITNPLYSHRYMDVLNEVLRAVSDVYDRILKLNFWLDRRPFDDKPEYIEWRRLLALFCGELVDCLNDPNNPKFFSIPQLLVERGESINKICLQMMHKDDPKVLYTSKLERIYLRKTTPESKWGFDVGIACTGVNVVTDIFEPTDGYDRRLAGKLDVGDEIVEVDGTSVVGWKHQMLSRKLDEQLFIRSTTTTQQGMIPPSCTAETTKSKSGGSNKFETVLLVCRRPIDDPVPPVRPPKISLLLPPPPYTDKEEDGDDGGREGGGNGGADYAVSVPQANGHAMSVEPSPHQNSSSRLLATDFKRKIFPFHHDTHLYGNNSSRRGPPHLCGGDGQQQPSPASAIYHQSVGEGGGGASSNSMKNTHHSSSHQHKLFRSSSLTSAQALSTTLVLPSVSSSSHQQASSAGGGGQLQMRKSCLLGGGGGGGKIIPSTAKMIADNRYGGGSLLMPFAAMIETSSRATNDDHHHHHGGSDCPPSSGSGTALFRRASIWTESPPATLRSSFDGICSESNAWLLLLTSWGARTPNSTTTSSGQQQLNNNGSGVGFGLPSHSQPSPITPDFTTATTISGSGTEGGESRVSVVLIEDDEEFTTEEEGGFSSSAGTTTFDMNLLSSSTDEAGGGGGIGITDRCRRRDAFLDPNSIVFSSVDTISDLTPISHQQPQGQILAASARPSASHYLLPRNHQQLLIASANDPEWWISPVKDITGLRLTKRTHLESGSSNTSIIDSPLAIIHGKIARFFGGGGDAPSPTAIPPPPPMAMIPHSITTPSIPSSAMAGGHHEQQQLRTPLVVSAPMTPGARFSHEFLSLFSSSSASTTSIAAPAREPSSSAAPRPSISTPLLLTSPPSNSNTKEWGNNNSRELSVPNSPFSGLSPHSHPPISPCWSFDSSGSGSSRAIKTIANQAHKRRPERLAPLAEPDIIDDIVCEPTAFTFPSPILLQNDDDASTPVGKAPPILAGENTKKSTSIMEQQPSLIQLAKTPCSAFDSKRNDKLVKKDETNNNVVEGWLLLLRTRPFEKPGCKTPTGQISGELSSPADGCSSSMAVALEKEPPPHFNRLKKTLSFLRRSRSTGSQWKKLWTVFDGESAHLFLYEKPSSTEASFVLNLTQFYLCKDTTALDAEKILKKRFLFYLRCTNNEIGEELLHFSAPSADDLARWCTAIGRFTKKAILPLSVSDELLLSSTAATGHPNVVSSKKRSQSAKQRNSSSTRDSENGRNFGALVSSESTQQPNSSTPSAEKSLFNKLLTRMSTRRRKRSPAPPNPIQKQQNGGGDEDKKKQQLEGNIC